MVGLVQLDDFAPAEHAIVDGVEVEGDGAACLTNTDVEDVEEVDGDKF